MEIIDPPAIEYRDNLFYHEEVKFAFAAKVFTLYQLVVFTLLLVVSISHIPKVKYLLEELDDYLFYFIVFTVLTGLIQGYSILFARKRVLSQIVFFLYFLCASISFAIISIEHFHLEVRIWLCTEFFSVFGLFLYVKSKPKKYSILDGLKFLIVFWTVTTVIYLAIVQVKIKQLSLIALLMLLKMVLVVVGLKKFL